MNKKIIALAVAAVFSTPAFADSSNVEVYGQANISFDRTNNGTVSTNQVSDNVSRIGLKGAEDLGDGLSAIWQIESAVNLDGGGSTLGGRNSFVGLSSADMGTVLAGNHDTPYKMATEGADVFHDTIADYRSIMGGATTLNHNSRAGNVAAYLTPDFGGISGAIAYIALAEAVIAPGVKPSAWSASANYVMGDINTSLAWQEIKDLAGVGINQKAWKLGAGYTMDAINVNGVYEKVSSSTGADDHTALYLSGKYTMGSDAVKLAYATSGDFNNVANTGGKQWTLGYDHNMSKRTTLFALYTTGAAESATPATAGLGGVTSAGVIAATSTAGNKDASAWSFGVKHSF
jgi:predicted porin